MFSTRPLPPARRLKGFHPVLDPIVINAFDLVLRCRYHAGFCCFSECAVQCQVSRVCRVSNEADADEVQDEHGVPYKRRVQLLLEHALELLLLEL